MDDEVKVGNPDSESSASFGSSVQESMKKRQEQFEVPKPNTVMEKMDALNQKTREVAKKFAENKIVKHIPVVSPLIEASLDFQKASAAAVYGKDVDTGAKLSGKERANVAASNFGKFLWNKTIADVESAALIVGGAKAGEWLKKGEKTGLAVYHAEQKSVNPVDQLFARLRPKSGAGVIINSHFVR